MDKEMIKVLLLTLSLLVIAVSFLIFNLYYRKYYGHMKKNHKDEWWALMKKDRLVKTAGEWTRWPLGSIYLLSSIFKVKETYNDPDVAYYKTKARASFSAFVASLLIFVCISVLFPRF